MLLRVLRSRRANGTVRVLVPPSTGRDGSAVLTATGCMTKMATAGRRVGEQWHLVA